MSNFTDKFFADKAVGALWDVAVSIKRGNPLPLDKDSVVHGLTELNAIAAGSVSYPGQIIAVVEDAVYEGEGDDKVLVKEESVTLYYLDHNKTPREVGKVPVGDEKTIEVDAEGKISLLGSAVAEIGTLPMLEEVEINGEKKVQLVWKTLEDIGAGDGNDNTTYTFDFEDVEEVVDGETHKVQKLVIQPYFNGQPVKNDNGENDPIIVDLSTFITEAELSNAIAAVEAKIPTNNNQLTNGAGYQTASDVAAAIADKADKATTLSGYGITDAYTKEEVNAELAKKASQDEFAVIKGKVETFFDDTKIGEEVIDTLQELINYINTHDDVEITDIIADIEALQTKVDTGDKKVSEYVTAAIDALKIGDYAKASDLTDLANELHNDYLTEDDFALAKDEIYDYIGQIPEGDEANEDGSLTPVAENVIAYVDLKAGEAKADAIADANAKLANKANTADVYAKTETYSQDEIDDLLEGIQAGSSESAASVKTQLDAYKKVVNAEVWGNEEGTGDSRIDTLETGVAAAIKDVKAATNAKITVSVGADKVATVDDAALQTLIGEAKKAGTDANSALETYKGTNDAAVDKVRTDLAAEAEKLATLTETVGGHTTKITNLETFQTEHTALYESLNTTVGTHGTDIAGLKTGKADASALNEAVGRISANETAISNRYTKEEANNLLNTKADKDSVYSKSEADNLLNAKADASAVYTKEEINATVATLATKTELSNQDTALKALITAEETRATGKEAELLAAIQKNAEDISKIDFIDETELAAAVKVETDRAVAKENELAGLISANSQAIAGNTAAINSILGNEDEIDLNSIAELAAWITEHGTEAEGMTEAIEANAAAIKVINETTIPGAITSANGYTDEAIAALTKTVDDNKTAAGEAVAALTKTVGDNKTAIEGTVSELATLVGNNKTATDAAIKAITDNYKVKDVDDTSLALDNNGVASVKAVSTDLLTQGSEELVFCAGDAGVKAAE